MRHQKRIGFVVGVLAAAVYACTADDPNVSPGVGTDEDGGTTQDGGGTDAPPTDGGLATDADASAQPRCNPTSPFGAPTLMGGQINGTTADVGITMSSDELVAVVEVDGHLLYTARTSRDLPFPKPTLDKVFALKTASPEVQPSLTADGLTLYFMRIGANDFLRVASRPTRDDAFVSDAPVMIDGNPGIGDYPRINRLGNRLMWLDDSHDNAYIADRNGNQATFASARSLAGALEFPVLSGDDKTLYFTETSPARKLRYATRPQPADPLGARMDVPAELQPYDAVHVTDDDCILYLVGLFDGGPGGGEILESRRGP